MYDVVSCSTLKVFNKRTVSMTFSARKEKPLSWGQHSVAGKGPQRASRKKVLKKNVREKSHVLRGNQNV